MFRSTLHDQARVIARRCDTRLPRETIASSLTACSCGPGGPILKARSLAKARGAARTSRPAIHPCPTTPVA